MKKLALILLVALLVVVLPAHAGPAFTNAPGTIATAWQVNNSSGPAVVANGSDLEMRTSPSGSFTITRGATPVASNDYATKAYVDTGGASSLSPWVVTNPACGAKGDGVNDDTAAIQECILLAEAAGGGVVYFPQPAVTYKISAPIAIVDPYISLIGTEGLGSVYNPAITQYAYPNGIFQFFSSHEVLQNLSGQYGPTTTLASSASAGSSSLSLTPVTLAGTVTVTNGLAGITFSQTQSLEANEQIEFSSQLGTWYTILASTTNSLTATLTTTFTGTGGTVTGFVSGCAPNDWLILDQPNPSLQSVAPMEQCQITSISGGTTANLTSCGVAIAPGPGSGQSLTQATTIFAHGSGAWVRNQPVVLPLFRGQPARDAAGFGYFEVGDDCLVQNAGVLAMVGGVYFGGVPTSNAQNNVNNAVDRFHTEFVQYAVLAQQQTGFKLTNATYVNATEGQAGAPGHGLYMTGLIGWAATWAIGTTYPQYYQVSYGTSLAGTASLTVGSPTVVFTNSQSLSSGTELTFSSQSGTSYAISGTCSGTTCTLAQNYYGSATGAGTATIRSGVEQYISISNGNVGHEPDTSPSFWSAQTYPTASSGWRSLNKDLYVDNVFGNPGANFKDWSCIKDKFTDGAVFTNWICEGAVRLYDLQECANCVIGKGTGRNFISPVSTDSAAAGITSLDNNQTIVHDVVINLTQDSQYGEIGGAIDMPAVYDRVDGVLDPINGSFLGHDNTFQNIKVFSNYDSSFVSAGYRIQSTQSLLLNDHLVDSGGQNPYAFFFSSNTTAGLNPNGCTLQRPYVAGTTQVAEISSTATSGYWDIDLNLLPNLRSPPTLSFSDPSGVITTNRFITNAGGVSTMYPQSATATWLGAVAPAGLNAPMIDFPDSTGNATFEVDARLQSGNPAIRLLTESPTATNPAELCLGTNATAGYSTSGQTVAVMAFPDNGGSCGTSGAGIFYQASENHGVGTLGGNMLFDTVLNGSTTQTKALGLYNNGNIALGYSGSALATSATVAFPFLPEMAGLPTGSITSPVGNLSAIAVDTTEHAIVANYGGANWYMSNALYNAASGPANGTTFTCGSLQRVSVGQSGNSYNLPAGSTCPGGIVVLKCTNNGGTNTYTVTPASGTIDGAASYTFTSQSENAAVTFESDGTNWQTWTQHVNVTNASGTLPLASLGGAGTAGNGLLSNGTNWTSTNTLYPFGPPTYNGITEENQDPAVFNIGNATVSGTLYVARLPAQTTTAAIGHALVYINTAGTLLAAPTTQTVTNATCSAGTVTLTLTASTGMSSGIITVASVGGLAEANGAFNGTLSGSTFTYAATCLADSYTSGGVVTISENLMGIYSSAGAFLSATGDQSSSWTSPALHNLALASTVSITNGTVYYVALLTVGTGTQPKLQGGPVGSVVNANVSGANLRWATNGTSLTRLPTSITPSSGSSGFSWWTGLNSISLRRPGQAFDWPVLALVGGVGLRRRWRRGVKTGRAAA